MQHSVLTHQFENLTNVEVAFSSSLINITFLFKHWEKPFCLVNPDLLKKMY